jgi:hypothetical protein
MWNVGHKGSSEISLYDYEAFDLGAEQSTSEILSLIGELNAFISEPRAYDRNEISRLSRELVKKRPEEIFTFPMGESHGGDYWCRIRQLGASNFYSLVDELVYRKEPAKEYGRCHTPGETVLYASRRWGTACDELELHVGDRFQAIYFDHLTLFESRTEAFALGELSTWFLSGMTMHGFTDTDSNLRANSIMVSAASSRQKTVALLNSAIVDGYLVKLFSAVSTQKNAPEHIVSGNAASVILNCWRVDSLLYLSSRDSNGFNLAVKKDAFDKKCRLLKTGVYRIVRRLPNGLYVAEVEKTSLEILPSGKIVWSEHRLGPQFVFSNRSGRVIKLPS